MIKLEEKTWNRTNKEANLLEDIKNIDMIEDFLDEVDATRGTFSYSLTEIFIEYWGGWSVSSIDDILSHYHRLATGNPALVLYYDVYDRKLTSKPFYGRTAYKIELPVKDTVYNKEITFAEFLSQLLQDNYNSIISKYLEEILNYKEYTVWASHHMLEDLSVERFVRSYNHLRENRVRVSDIYLSDIDKERVSGWLFDDIMTNMSITSQAEELIRFLSKEDKATIITDGVFAKLENDIDNSVYNLDTIKFLVQSLDKFKVIGNNRVKEKYAEIIEKIKKSGLPEYDNLLIKLSSSDFTQTVKGIVPLNNYSLVINSFTSGNYTDDYKTSFAWLSDKTISNADKVIVNDLQELFEKMVRPQFRASTSMINRCVELRDSKILVPTKHWELLTTQIKVLEEVSQITGIKTPYADENKEWFYNNFELYNGKVPEQVSNPVQLLR